MITRFLSSPGRSLLITPGSLHPTIAPAAPPSPSSPLLPVTLETSILYPELQTFAHIVEQLEHPRTSAFEVFQGPIRLRQKILIRSLLGLAATPGDKQVDLQKLERFLGSDFPAEFKGLLQKQGFTPQSEVTQFIESLRERFENLEGGLEGRELSSFKWLIFVQFLINIGVFAGLFYTTYFWKDWEVAEPISYLNVVLINLVYLGSMIYARRVSGTPVKILSSGRAAKLALRRQKYTLNRKRFETFYYEYNELLRNLN